MSGCIRGDKTHERCSFKISEAHKSWIARVEHGSLSPQDTLVYGTSDPTINPAEIWLTANVAQKENIYWKFFNYPLASVWEQQDITFIFSPYEFPYADPFEVVADMDIPAAVLGRFSFGHLQELVSSDDPLMERTLEDLVHGIRPFRTTQRFCVINRMKPVYEQVHCSRHDKLYSGYKQKTLRDLISNREEKLGGTIIYFLFGYHCSTNNYVALMPHNWRGDVWGAVAAGAERAGKQLRVYPAGGIDFMTAKQWELYRLGRKWRKAPHWVLKRLQSHEFKVRALKELLVHCNYCAFSYDEKTDSFSFELGTP